MELMPRMHGHTLARQLWRREPNLKMPYLTGYSESALQLRESLEDVLMRLKDRLRALEVLIKEQDWRDASPEGRDAAQHLLEETVKASARAASALQELIPSPIASYRGEPIGEWLEQAAARKSGTR
jgi:DNA-binding LytR/AlgR family response regulator